MIVNYDRKTFIVQATEVDFIKHFHCNFFHTFLKVISFYKKVKLAIEAEKINKFIWLTLTLVQCLWSSIWAYPYPIEEINISGWSQGYKAYFNNNVYWVNKQSVLSTYHYKKLYCQFATVIFILSTFHLVHLPFSQLAI